MRDIKLKLEPFDFISVLDCEIYKSLNNHSLLKFVCRISTDQEQIIMNTNISYMPIKLKMSNEDKVESIIFSGIIKDFSIKKVGDTRVLSLNGISNTYLMDIVKKTRVFQDPSSTYEDILNYISNYHDYKFIMNIGSNTSIERLIVQYNETDFEFIKRLASHFNTSISSAYLTDGVKYFFGLPQSTKNFVLKDDYVIRKELIEDLRKDSEQLPFSIDKGATIIEMVSRNIYDIGDYTLFNGQEFLICSVETKYVGNELKHKYILKENLGQYVSKYYNANIIGASISAIINEVSSDKVKVYIMEDGIQNSKKWFSFSTVYSSPDGTGWYCMPEIGDNVRLYFPTEKEHHGYVISAVHLECNNSNQNVFNQSSVNLSQSGGNSTSQSEVPRSNPDNKSLKSKHGKEVLFTPNSVVFTNNNGMRIEILDDEGIFIMSDKKVSITSDEQIDIVSMNESINIDASESILLEQIDSKIEIKDEIKLTGVKTRIE